MLNHAKNLKKFRVKAAILCKRTLSNGTTRAEEGTATCIQTSSKGKHAEELETSGDGACAVHTLDKNSVTIEV